VPREEVPFRNETVPVGTTLPAESKDAERVTVCPTLVALGEALNVTVVGRVDGGVEVPPNSIAPIDGEPRRVIPKISLTKPGIGIPVPIAGLAELRLKLKLSRTVSDEILSGGSSTNLASAQISPVKSVGHPPLRNP
jgi:hypothetical protein